MVNNLNQNFEMYKRMQKQKKRNEAGPSRPRANEAGPSRRQENIAGPSSVKCKSCGANQSKFFNNNVYLSR